jgi:anthranilate phosphoribosyltransferase
MLLFALQQGNWSSSSACGSADVLEELGVVMDLDPEVGSSWIEVINGCSWF